MNAISIPTWNTLPARGNCDGIVADEAHAFTLAWSFDLGGWDETQHVRAVQIRASGEAWLVMTAVVGAAGELARRARRNGALTVGRFGMMNGDVVITHAVAMHKLTAAEVERLCGIIAYQAARFRVERQNTYCS